MLYDYDCVCVGNADSMLLLIQKFCGFGLGFEALVSAVFETDQ